MTIFFRSLLSAFLLLLIPGFLPAQVNITVTELPSMPMATSNNAVCATPTSIFSFGGIDISRHSEGIHLHSFRYNAGSNSWETLPDMPDTLGKVAAAASYVNGRIYVIGGYHVAPNGNEYTSNKVHRYSLQWGDWTTDGAPIPTPVDDHVQVVWRDSLIFCITGWSGDGPSGTNVPDVQIYNPEANSWTAANPVPNTNDYKVFGAAGTIIGDTIYYFGGARLGFNFPASNSFVKGAINPNDPTDITWERTVPTPSVFGYRMAATRRYGKAYWFGGSAITYNYNGLAYSNNAPVPPANIMLSYDPATGLWDTSTVALPMDLRGIGEPGLNVRYIAGGMLDGPEVTDKAWEIFMSDPNPVEELATENALRVFPVPASEALNVSLPGEKLELVRLYNTTGQLVTELAASGSQLRLPVQNLAPGPYIVVAVASGNAYQRLVTIK